MAASQSLILRSLICAASSQQQKQTRGLPVAATFAPPMHCWREVVADCGALDWRASSLEEGKTKKALTP